MRQGRGSLALVSSYSPSNFRVAEPKAFLGGRGYYFEMASEQLICHFPDWALQAPHKI